MPCVFHVHSAHLRQSLNVQSANSLSHVAGAVGGADPPVVAWELEWRMPLVGTRGLNGAESTLAEMGRVAGVRLCPALWCVHCHKKGCASQYPGYLQGTSRN